MSEEEILNQIEELERQINNLENKKKSYENMNIKINKAISSLNAANKYSKIATLSFGQNYQSKAANLKKMEFERENMRIEELIKSLKNDVLVTIHKKIKDINSNIEEKKRQIGELRSKLPSEDV